MATASIPNSGAGIGLEKTRVMTPDLLVLCGSMTAAMTCFYLLLSAVPVHAATLGGEMGAGLATGVLMAATIGGELVTTRLIARLGRRVAMAIALLLLAVPSLFAFSDNLTLVFLGCATRGLGLGIVLVAACGLATLLAPAARRSEALGLYGLASAAPAILAVPLGPWMLAQLGANATAMFATFVGLAALATLHVFPGRDPGPRTRAKSTARLAFRPLAWPASVLAAGAILLGASITFLPLAQGKAVLSIILLAMLLQGLAAALGRWLSGRWVDRRGPHRVMVSSLLLAVVAALCLSATGPLAVLAGMALSGLAFGGLQSGSLALMLERSTIDQADGVSAAWNIAYDAGLGIGGIGFGGLLLLIGYDSSFIALGIGIALLTGLVFLGFERNATPMVGAAILQRQSQRLERD